MRLAKLAVASVSPTVGAVVSNVSRIVSVAREMGAADVTIGAFPEQVIGGYPPEDLVQWRGFRGRPAVTRDEVQARDGNVELVAARVLEGQELSFAFAEIQGDETEVAADPVLLVHDRVDDLDLREVAHHSFGRSAVFPLAPAAHGGNWTKPVLTGER